MSGSKARKAGGRKAGEPLADPAREAYAGRRAAGMGRAEAYRAAHPKATPASASAAASRLERDPEVRARIAELTDGLLKSSDAWLTKSQLAELLSGAIRRALTEEKLLSSASGLVDRYCRMFGFYEPEKVEARVGCLDEAARDRKIARLVGSGELGVRSEELGVFSDASARGMARAQLLTPNS